MAFERKGGRLGSQGGGFRAEAGEDHGTVGLTHGTGGAPFPCVFLACSGPLFLGRALHLKRRLLLINMLIC